MKFFGVRECKPNEVIKYVYVYEMNENEARGLKSFIKDLFRVYTEVDTFNIHANSMELSDINGVPFNPYYDYVRNTFDKSNLNILGTYIKDNFNVKELEICDILCNSKYLFCYTLNKV